MNMSAHPKAHVQRHALSLNRCTEMHRVCSECYVTLTGDGPRAASARAPDAVDPPTAMDTQSWGSQPCGPEAGGDAQFALDALPDGCLTNVLEHLDVQSLLAIRGVSRRSQQLASQPTLWR